MSNEVSVKNNNLKWVIWGIMLVIGFLLGFVIFKYVLKENPKECEQCKECEKCEKCEENSEEKNQIYEATIADGHGIILYLDHSFSYYYNSMGAGAGVTVNGEWSTSTTNANEITLTFGQNHSCKFNLYNENNSINNPELHETCNALKQYLTE